MKFAWSCLTICVATAMIFLPCGESSAIPMWEFLSRTEKMSQLYRIFGERVALFCSNSSRPDCSKNLLVSGIKKLVELNDDQLDKLDPYQRGGVDRILQAMIGSSRFATREDYENDEVHFAGDSTVSSGSETNGINDDLSERQPGPYLAGPMVIRVYPDGRPVPEDATRTLPRDEDADDLRYPRIPSIEEIESPKNRRRSNSRRRSIYRSIERQNKRNVPYY